MVDKLHIQSFDKPSVLWGIDGDWMVNYIPEGKEFYPTDHCGVLRIVDTSVFNTHYVMYMLKQEGERAGFNRTYRASVDRVGGLSIPKIPIEVQNTIMREVEVYEKKIAAEEQKLIRLKQRRREIEDQILTFV